MIRLRDQTPQSEPHWKGTYYGGREPHCVALAVQATLSKLLHWKNGQVSLCVTKSEQPIISISSSHYVEIGSITNPYSKHLAASPSISP